MLRLPEELHKWLKENIQGSINDFVVSLIDEKRKSVKVGELKPSEDFEAPEYEVNPEIKELIGKRETLLWHCKNSTQSFQFTIQEIKEKATFKDCFEELETHYFDFDSASWLPDFVEVFIDKIGGREGKAWKEYFEPALKLSSHNQFVLFEEKERREKWERCGGDPDEIVYKRITRQDIYFTFSRDKEYSVSDIAGGLGLTYMQAYMNIVPWMKREGFKIT